MKHRLEVYWQRRIISPKPLPSHSVGKPLTHIEKQHMVLDGECLIYFDEVCIKPGWSFDDAFEKIHFPPGLWVLPTTRAGSPEKEISIQNTEHLGFAVQQLGMSAYLYCLRLAYHGRTMAFYWWQPSPSPPIQLPDEFHLDSLPGRYRHWTETGGIGTGEMIISTHSQSMFVWAELRANDAEEAAALSRHVSSDAAGTTLESFYAVAQEIKRKTDLIPDLMQKQEAIPARTAAMLRGAIKQRLGTLGTVVEEDFTASPHFKNLTWRGNQYVLRQTTAVIIETLYIALKHYGISGFHQAEVFAQVYGSNKKNWPSNKTRIQNFFRTGDAKRLWDDGLIGHDNKGNFHLNLKIHTPTQ